MKATFFAGGVVWAAAQELGAVLQEASVQTGAAAHEILDVQASLAKLQVEANQEYSNWDGIRRQLDAQHTRLQAEVADWKLESSKPAIDTQVASAERLLLQTQQKLRAEESSMVNVRSAWVSHKAAVDESLGALEKQVSLARQQDAQSKARVMQVVEEESTRETYIENRTSSLAGKLRGQRDKVSWAQVCLPEVCSQCVEAG